MWHAHVLITVSLIAAGRLQECSAKPTASALSSPTPECDEPSDEFFYLVQQWPAGYCAEERCSRTPPASKFTIHGFWPNYCKDRSGKEWPQFCSREKLDLEILDDLVPTMESEWPSLSNAADSSFWEHEWDKHGTCALAFTPFGLNSQREYFETVLKLHEDNNLYDNFEANGIRPGGSYSVSDIQSTLVKTLGGDAFLHCQGNNVLVEVYICYNEHLERTPCSKQGTCNHATDVQYMPNADRLESIQ